jgi:hypothetical protein
VNMTMNGHVLVKRLLYFGYLDQPPMHMPVVDWQLFTDRIIPVTLTMLTTSIAATLILRWGRAKWLTEFKVLLPNYLWWFVPPAVLGWLTAGICEGQYSTVTYPSTAPPNVLFCIGLSTAVWTVIIVFLIEFIVHCRAKLRMARTNDGADMSLALREDQDMIDADRSD